jgi:molybdopterin converting factor small subunit
MVNQVLQYIAGGSQKFEVNGGTVRECLDLFVAEFPQVKEILFKDQGELFGYVNIFVNSESCLSEGLDKPVVDGDEIYILTIIDGG